MKQRIQFGSATSLGRVALRGAVGGRFEFTVPRFGTQCVCCSTETMGRTQDYDPSTDRVKAAPVAMPVCFACTDHALQTAFAPLVQACGVLVGLALTWLAIGYLRERPHDTFLWGAIAVGVAMVGASIAWIVASRRRKTRNHVAGHHPGLELSVGHGRTLLDTDNEQLVEELLALNPNARRLPTPMLWRMRGEGLPAARAIAPARRDDRKAELPAKNEPEGEDRTGSS